MAEAKKTGNETLMEQAKQYVRDFKSEIINLKSQMPAGHYEMYSSAVLVYELRTKQSVHPIKSMSLAKKATELAPDDPIVLSYYGTCLFYAPAPFGDKRKALSWFEQAQPLFQDTLYRYSWMREANQMYIKQSMHFQRSPKTIYMSPGWTVCPRFFCHQMVHTCTSV